MFIAVLFVTAATLKSLHLLYCVSKWTSCVGISTKEQSRWAVDVTKIRQFQTSHSNSSSCSCFLLSFDSLCFQRIHQFCLDCWIYSTKLFVIFPTSVRMARDFGAAIRLFPGLGNQCLSFLVSLARTYIHFFFSKASFWLPQYHLLFFIPFLIVLG